MERIQIKVSKTPPDAFKCCRLDCADLGVNRVNELHDGKWGFFQDYCDIHFEEFMNNGLLDVVQDL